MNWMGGTSAEMEAGKLREIMERELAMEDAALWLLMCSMGFVVF